MNPVLKVLWVALLFALVKAQPNLDDTEFVNNLADSCKEEVGANDDDIMALVKHDPNIRKEGKCLINCLAKQYAIVDESGKPDVETTNKLLAMLGIEDDVIATVEGIMKACSTVDDADECEFAYKFAKCVHEEGEKHGLTNKQ